MPHWLTQTPSDPLYFRLELLANAYRMHHPDIKKLTKSGTFPILPRLPAGAFSLNNHGFLELLTNASYPEATEERDLMMHT